jgi:polyphenol oxidase
VGGAFALFTDRHGGESTPPFDTWNLALHVGDESDRVAANRQRAVALSGATGDVWLEHVHGCEVLRVDEPERGARADGAATSTRGLALTAMGADCAPIAIANDTACAAVHAGWRGLAEGVVAAGVAAVQELGTGPVHAVIGPCICVGCYEFGADDLTRVALALGPEVVGATREGAPALDLPAGIRSALAREGVASVDEVGVCTLESTDHYSYRRDGITGRQGVVIALP